MWLREDLSNKLCVDIVVPAIRDGAFEWDLVLLHLNQEALSNAFIMEYVITVDHLPPSMAVDFIKANWAGWKFFFDFLDLNWLWCCLCISSSFLSDKKRCLHLD